MDKTNYQGWKNRATWACALWLDNGLDIRGFMAALDEKYTGIPITAKQAKEIVMMVFPAGIPDLVDKKIDWDTPTNPNPVYNCRHGDISWPGIADMLNEALEIAEKD